MKIILFGVVGLLAFVGILAGLLALDGNLSPEALQRMVNPPPPEAAPAFTQDPVNPLAQALKQKETALRQKQQELDEREARLEQREKELNRLRTDLENMRAEIGVAMDEADAERTLRLQSVADT